jgi:hypothetical protein
MAGRARGLKLEQFWRRHLREQATSGLSIRSYCFRNGLREGSFYSWRRAIQERDRQVSGSSHPSSSAPAFVPVTVAASPRPCQSSIVIQLPGGPRVQVRVGCDRQLLSDVLTLLGHPTTRDAREGRPC